MVASMDVKRCQSSPQFCSPFPFSSHLSLIFIGEEFESVKRYTMDLNHLCVKIGSIHSKSQSGDDNCQAQFQLTSSVPVELIWPISQDMAIFSSWPNLGTDTEFKMVRG